MPHVGDTSSSSGRDSDSPDRRTGKAARSSSLDVLRSQLKSLDQRREVQKSSEAGPPENLEDTLSHSNNVYEQDVFGSGKVNWEIWAKQVRDDLSSNSYDDRVNHLQHTIRSVSFNSDQVDGNAEIHCVDGPDQVRKSWLGPTVTSKSQVDIVHYSATFYGENERVEEAVSESWMKMTKSKEYKVFGEKLTITSHNSETTTHRHDFTALVCEESIEITKAKEYEPFGTKVTLTSRPDKSITQQDLEDPDKPITWSDW